MPEGLQRVFQPGRAALRPRPAQHRALQRRDRSRVELARRMLEQREQRHRRKAVQRRFGGEPREHAGRRIGKRVAAGIVHRHVPARQRRQHAAGQRPVGRHQRGGLAGIVHRLAQRNGDGQRLLLGVGGLDHRDAGERGIGMSGESRHPPGVPAKARWPRPAAAPPRPGVRGRAVRAAPAPSRCRGRCRCVCSSADMANCGWPCAASVSASPLGDHVPGRVVEIGVEAGQHQRAVRQLARWWRAMSRSPGSSRSSLPRSPGRCWSQAVWLRPRSACRGARPARCGLSPSGVAGQCRADDLQEVERLLPVFVHVGPAPARRAGPTSPAASPCRPSAAPDPGERQRRGRTVGDERRLIASPRGAMRRAHFRIKLRERHGALEVRRAPPADRAPRRRSRRSRLRRRQAHPRRRRRSARCAAGSPRRA